MKRTPTIVSIIMLAGGFLYACGSMISTGNTSFVTISIGGDSHTARLNAERATPWLKVKYFLADAKLMPEAQAYIPSVVQAIIVTATAPDIPTPIVGVANIAADQTKASIRLEVPNGPARNFLVEGYRGVDSLVYFSGTTIADISGKNITLPVSMNFVGPGIWVSPTGSDTGGTGTQASPYLTISRALSATTGTHAILVSAGTYTLTVGAASPTLQLKPENALICLGAGFSSVIDASATSGVDLIYGAEGASIDNCKLIPSSDTTAIDDRVNGLIGSRIKINGVLIDANPAVGGALDGIMLSADSLVLETTILNTTGNGISVLGGKPTIRNVDLQNNPVGIAVTGNGEPTINEVFIAGEPVIPVVSLYGISIATTGQPSISGSSITNYLQGIYITNGNPIIRNNNITLNSTGISIATSTGSSPVINANNIYCNSSFDADIGSIVVVDLRDNSWDHDTTTNPVGPIVNSGNCFPGNDICVRGTNPLYTPFRPAVPSGCL
jgi:hypothetical protein